MTTLDTTTTKPLWLSNIQHESIIDCVETDYLRALSELGQSYTIEDKVFRKMNMSLKLDIAKTIYMRMKL